MSQGPEAVKVSLKVNGCKFAFLGIDFIQMEGSKGNGGADSRESVSTLSSVMRIHTLTYLFSMGYSVPIFG